MFRIPKDDLESLKARLRYFENRIETLERNYEKSVDLSAARIGELELKLDALLRFSAHERKQALEFVAVPAQPARVDVVRKTQTPKP